MPRHPSACVRAAAPSELPAVADVLARAFLNDPTMVYYGYAPALVADPAHPTPADEGTIRGLHAFQSAVMSAAPPAQDLEEEGFEKIIAVALCLPPGVTLDLKQPREAAARARSEPGAGTPKVTLTWGPIGKKRLAEYAPVAEGILTREFAARTLDRLDSWHVFAIAVDPLRQGSGYSSMLFKEGFRRASPKPVHLVASKPQNKDIYEHLGFELVETFTVGSGEVDASGLKAEGESVTGLQEFAMIKWTS